MNLRIEKIEKNYTDFRLHLDLEVRQGELLILLGPSGCGKTTTLRMLAGFIDPDSGSLRMNGTRIDTLPTHRRHIGLVFQDYALFPHLNVQANVGFGLRMQGWTPREIRTRVDELLALVSLEGYGKRKVTRLSGGEQQRVALARALAPNPKLLLLDEPLSALDARLRMNLRVEIKRIQRELGITTVYVTHDQEEALVMGDRIAVMRNGHIEQVGTPETIYNRPEKLFVGTFLGRANLLKGRISGWDGEEALIETRTGTVRAVYPKKGELNKGNEVIAFFRPEQCEPDPSGFNRLQGRLVRKEYLGTHHVFELEAPENRQYIIYVNRGSDYTVGDMIEFSIEPKNICLFPSSDL